MRNLTAALFEHERITTTMAKAKEVRRFVDSIIGLAKGGSLHDRRRAFALMGNKTILNSETGERTDPLTKVFNEFSKRYASRPGGYTRIIRIGNRPGDAAPNVILELVDANLKVATKGSDEEEAKPTKRAAKAKPKAKAEKPKKAAKSKAA